LNKISKAKDRKILLKRIRKLRNSFLQLPKFKRQEISESKKMIKDVSSNYKNNKNLNK